MRTLKVCLLIITLCLFSLAGCSDSYESTYESTPSGLDTSEESRRRVTDKMIEQGSDPIEAEAFTSELYKAQREWEADNK